MRLVVDSLNTELVKLEKELADNRKLASLITIEVRAIFTRERAKIEIPPEPVPGALELKTRSVNVSTSSSGSGNHYEHPTKLDYNNPIEIIHFEGGKNCFMRFATRDGDLGQQPLSSYSLACKAVLQAGTQVDKIQVFHNYYIYGLRFFDHAGACVLQAGYCGTDHYLVEIALEQGERLLAVKSRLYDNGGNNTCHCNPVFVLGKLE